MLVADSRSHSFESPFSSQVQTKKRRHAREHDHFFAQCREELAILGMTEHGATGSFIRSRILGTLLLTWSQGKWHVRTRPERKWLRKQRGEWGCLGSPCLCREAWPIHNPPYEVPNTIPHILHSLYGKPGCQACRHWWAWKWKQ